MEGNSLFVQAFADLKASQPNIQSVIVGGVWQHELEYEADSQRLLRDLKVEASLRMFGLQRNVPQWMQAMDVVHASHREPLVATVLGGTAEIIIGRCLRSADALG